ncbi:MAG: hypothetical protein AAF975_00505 [Spirochaetota bacterium]
MNLHTTPQNKLFSSAPHGLFTQQYEEEIGELFAKFQVLELSLTKYRKIPLHRKQERLKESFTLFRVYWQNLLKALLPYIREQNINNPRLFMRYGLVHLSDITPEDLEALKMVALHIDRPCSVFYIDEWFHNIATSKVPLLHREGGAIKASAKKDKDESHVSLDLIRESTSLEKLMESLCAGSKSVATPFLHKNDLSRPIAQQVASREAVEKAISMIKNIDPQVFTRKLLKEEVELEPYVIIVPCYSEFGACWEAFDRLERTTSRGRVIIPLYALNTQRAVLVALANYRWETAKLSAGSYWLEKGLTGGFYDLYRKHSLPGRNEQQAFVAAYCQWILDESRGQIRLHPEVREFFWDEIPFEESRAKILSENFAQFQRIVNTPDDNKQAREI